MVNLREQVNMKKRICIVPECAAPLVARGYCQRHYMQVRRHGVIAIPVRPDRPTWHPIVKYRAAHWRIAVLRGPASDHQCVDCGRTAEQWSYDATDPNELIDPDHGTRPLTYSLDSEHYSPRCVICHRRFDGALRSVRT